MDGKILDLNRFREKKIIKKQQDKEVKFNYDDTTEVKFNFDSSILAELEKCKVFLKVSSWAKVVGIGLTILKMWREAQTKGETWDIALVKNKGEEIQYMTRED